MRNFQIFIISAVKICKQCLHTASASRGLPDPIPGFRPLTLLGDFHLTDLQGYSPQMKIPGAALKVTTNLPALSSKSPVRPVSAMFYASVECAATASMVAGGTASRTV